MKNSPTPPKKEIFTGKTLSFQEGNLYLKTIQPNSGREKTLPLPKRETCNN
jgi:hypothetical protein